MKKIIIILSIILIAGCGAKKQDQLDYKCEKVTINKDYTYKEVIGYYSFEDGEASKILFMEDYIPSTSETSLAVINSTVSKKENGLSKYDDLTFNKETVNSKIFIDYNIKFSEKNMELLKEDEQFKKYIENGLFRTDLYIEDLVINGYTCS